MGISLQIKRLEYILWLNQMLLDLKRTSECLGIDNSVQISRIGKRIRKIKERVLINYYLAAQR